MMAEYIDREKTLKLLRGCYPTKWQGTLPDGRICHYSDVIEAVEIVPVADVAPVVHAHWEKHIMQSQPIGGWRVADTVLYSCSNCGTHEDGPAPYCRTCGAKMDEE